MDADAHLNLLLHRLQACSSAIRFEFFPTTSRQVLYQHCKNIKATYIFRQEDFCMPSSDTIFRCFSFVESQLRDSQAPDAKSITPFVTISRQTGSGAHHVGNELVDILNHKENPPPGTKWALWDSDLVSKVLDFHNLSSRMSSYMPEDTVNEFNSTIEEMMGLHPSSNELVSHTAHTIRALAKKGHCVLIGRGSHVITHGMRDGVHVRLIGSLDKRCERIAIEHRISPTKALDFIKHQDRARARYLHYYYNRDINDGTLYDLVINTDAIDTRSVATLIATLLCHRLSMRF